MAQSGISSLALSRRLVVAVGKTLQYRETLFLRPVRAALVVVQLALLELDQGQG
jgi:hypothetical protein